MKLGIINFLEPRIPETWTTQSTVTKDEVSRKLKPRIARKGPVGLVCTLYPQVHHTCLAVISSSAIDWCQAKKTRRAIRRRIHVQIRSRFVPRYCSISYGDLKSMYEERLKSGQIDSSTSSLMCFRHH